VGVLGPVGGDGAPVPLVVGVTLVALAQNELAVLRVEGEALLHGLVVELALGLPIVPGAVHRTHLAPRHRHLEVFKMLKPLLIYH
jgi:hypothetical protein